MTGSLSPFVYWAQTEENITLKVELKDVKQSEISLDKQTLQFCAHGQGAKGPHKYEFSLDFHLPINTEASNYKVLDSKVDFTLRKQTKEWWPKLICNPQKPAWLKIDFDRWQSEDDVEEPVRDVTQDYPNMYNKVMEEEYGYRKEDFKKVYLTMYNFAMFIGYLYILLVMMVRYFRDGPHSMPSTYEAVGSAFRFIQLISWLEVMHPLFGYTKGGILTALLQVGGRTFLIFCMIEAEPRMQTKPVVFYLFLLYATIEIVRYPYYISQLFKKNVGFLTWLRYTIWIPLYPLGFLCEGIIVLRNIPYFEETKQFTVSLPNAWNYSFHFPTFLRLLLLFLFLPSMYTLMSHMYRTRVKKLGPKSWKKRME